MNQLIVQRAALLLESCMHLEEGEELLIVSDGTLSPSLEEAFLIAGAQLGANPSAVTYRAHRYVSLKEFARFGAASLETSPRRLPPTIIAALTATDVAVVLNSDVEIIFDSWFLDVARGNCRVGWAPYLNEDVLLRLLPASMEEVRELHETTAKFGDAFANAREAHVYSDAGTDLTLRLGEHRVNWSSGVHEHGKGYGGIELWPGGQVSSVPNHLTVSGRLVIDRSLSAPEFQEPIDSIVLTVEKGRVTTIEGGVEADRLSRFLDSIAGQGDPYHLTELGTGTNSKCMTSGRGGFSEDTHTLGCVSFALGADVHIGGSNAAGCHTDMTMRAATLALDGEVIVRDGKVV